VYHAVLLLQNYVSVFRLLLLLQDEEYDAAVMMPRRNISLSLMSAPSSDRMSPPRAIACDAPCSDLITHLNHTIDVVAILLIIFHDPQLPTLLVSS